MYFITAVNLKKASICVMTNLYILSVTDQVSAKCIEQLNHVINYVNK